MLPSTMKYQKKAKDTIRNWKGRIQIDYTDPFLDQSIETEANEIVEATSTDQTANNIENPTQKWASLDGSWELGEYWLMPADGSAQTGWWGKSFADEGGYFTDPYPTLTMTFFSRPIHRLKTVGDSLKEEYPVDFTIRLYDEQENVLHEEVVTNNTFINWTKNIEPVLQVVKMELSIQKWSHPGRQAKILEFFTSVRQTYEGDDILLISLLEDRDVADGSLPIGNISANEIEVRLNNIDNRFDAGNTESSLYQLLKANRRIQAWIGLDLLDEPDYIFDGNEDLTDHEVDSEATIDGDSHVAELFNFMFGMTPEYTEETEWKPLGTFWSGDWEVPEGEIWAHTVGRDRMELLRKSTFSISQVLKDTNLYELAEMVLQDAEVDDYWIDPELKEYTIPYAWFEPVTHRSALRTIVEACLGQAYCSRDNIIRVEGPSFLKDERTQSQITITQDDYFNKDQPVKWSEIANYIEVETKPLRPDTFQEVYRMNEPEEIGAGESQTLTIHYNEPPVIDAIASVEGTGTITNVNYYAWGANVTVSSNTAGEFILVIEGRPLKVLNKERVVVEDSESIIDNGRLRYKFPDNHLVQRRVVAQKIANGLLVFANPRRDIELEWRGNPALELADRFTAPDYKDVNEADFHIVSQSLEFDGGLTSTIKGRRANND